MDTDLNYKGISFDVYDVENGVVKKGDKYPWFKRIQI